MGGGGYYCFIFIPLNQYYNKKALFNWSVKGIMIQTSPYLVREGWGGGKIGRSIGTGAGEEARKVATLPPLTLKQLKEKVMKHNVCAKS